MLRLTTEQLTYLTGYLSKSNLRPGTYIRRLLVIAIEKQKFKSGRDSRSQIEIVQ